MAAAKNAPAPQGTEVTLKQGTAISADLAAELEADAGAGSSQNPDDNILPFVVLLQDMSPEVKKRDPEYVEGAEVGMWLNKATRQLYAPSDEEAKKTGLPMLYFQPCAFDRCVVEWVPRNDGGGFVARHDMKGSPEQTIAALGGKMVPDPLDPNKKLPKTADGKHDLIDTRYYFGHVMDEAGNIQSAAVVSFSSTGHTPAKEWMSLINNFRLGSGKTAPSWAKKYKIRSKPKKNTKGDFFIAAVDDAGIVESAAARATGKALYESFTAGRVKADVANADNSGAEGDGSPI